MKYIAIFRTISFKLHPLVWEKSVPSEYDNDKTIKDNSGKSKYDTIGQIFEWEPSLRDSAYDSENFICAIGLYHPKYFSQKTGIISPNDPEQYPSILIPKNYYNKNYFIRHVGNKIEMSFEFKEKIQNIKSESLDSAICEYIHKKRNTNNLKIGTKVGQTILYPLFFKISLDEFLDICKENAFEIQI